jgi:hypothetical protein
MMGSPRTFSITGRRGRTLVHAVHRSTTAVLCARRRVGHHERYLRTPTGT